MYSRSVFGNYYPVESLIHKLNPIFKLINFVIYFVLTIICKSIYLHLFMFGLVFVMILMSNVPFKFYFDMFYSLRFLYIILILIMALCGLSLNVALVILLKIISTVLYLGLIMYTTSTTEIIYAVQKIIWPFNLMNKDTTKISVYISYGLSFIPLMLTTEQKVLKSMSGRGIDYYHSGLFGKLYARLSVFKNIFVLTIERMNMTKLSNELRLFTLNSEKTNLRTNVIGFYDVLFLLFHLLIIYAFVMGV